MLSATLVQPMENSEAASIQISRRCPIDSYSSRRKHMDIQQFQLWNKGKMQRSPWADQQVRLQGWSQQLCLVPAPWTILKAGRVGPWKPEWTGCRWWAGHPLQPQGLHILPSLVRPCYGFPTGQQAAYPASLLLTHIQCSLLDFEHFLAWWSFKKFKKEIFSNIKIMSWSLSSVLRHNLISVPQMFMTPGSQPQKFSCQNGVDRSSGL